MRSSTLLLASTLILASLAPRRAHADPMDPAGARELLKQGYALKQQKKYAEALDRLLESLRLDSQIKTLINIADCEEKLGQLVLAQKHWILARDQAALQSTEPLKAEAEKRLASLEARMPRLTVKLVEPAGTVAEVRRDGVLLGRVSLGVPLPVDPGAHEVRVTATGHAEQRYTVDSVEHDAKVLEASVGAELGEHPKPAVVAAAAAPPAVPASAPELAKSPRSAAIAAPTPTPALKLTSTSPTEPQDTGVSQTKLWSGRRITAVGVAGVGVVSFATAGYMWWRANAQHSEAQGGCTPRCSDAARSMQGNAVSNAKLSTIFVVAGGALVAGGAALWLTAPHSALNVGVTPVAGRSDLGLVAHGAF